MQGRRGTGKVSVPLHTTTMATPVPKSFSPGGGSVSRLCTSGASERVALRLGFNPVGNSVLRYLQARASRELLLAQRTARRRASLDEERR